MATACRNPFISQGLAFPCGQCEPCLYNRRQVWAYRLQLEAMCHEHSSFVTLTYDDEHLPGNASLCPEHVQSWLKVLRERERSEGRFFRFYLVGEYGEKTHRPHYHLILFGYKPCLRGRTRRDFVSGELRGSNCCCQCSLIFDTWSRGLIEVGEVNKDSCAYIAGYVLKKMTRFDDPRLNGRNPEFCRMSNRKGIGFGRVSDIADSLRHFGRDDDIDVPLSLMTGDKRKPLGSYLRRKLREAIGREVKAPQAVLDAMAAELLPLRQVAFDGSSSFKDEVVKAGEGKFLNMMARQQLFRKGRSL